MLISHQSNNSIGTHPISTLETPESDEEMVRFVDVVFETLRAPKRGHEKRWKEAILMIAGEQWLDFDEATNSFKAANMADWVPKPVTNYLAKVYDRGIDIFTSGDLKAATRPPTDDQADIDAAVKSEQILHYLHEELKTWSLQSLGAAWIWATGNVILKAYYDLDAGSIVKTPRTALEETPFLIPNPDGTQTQLTDAFDEPVFDVTRVQKRDEQGNPVFEERKEGQVAETALSPFNWYPEIIEIPSDVTYGVEIQVVSIDQLRELFGTEAVEGIGGEDISEFSLGNFLDSKMNHLLANETDEHILLKTYRSEPSERWEEGKVIITAADKLLHEGPLERYYGGKLPYEHVRYRELPGEFWGVGPLDAAVPLQKRINAIDATIVHHRKTMVNPQVFEPKGANLSEMTGRMGARIIWDWKASGGNRPEIKPSVPLSPEVRNEREATIRDLEAIVGTVEVLSGQQPSGVDTLGQTQILAEQALRRFAPIVRRWRRGLAEHERKKLVIAQEMWNTPRMVRVVGDNETIEIKHFMGADIGNTQDVLIREESSVVFSEAFRQQKVMQAAQMGLLDISNPAIASKVMDLLEIPGFVNQFNLDAKLARRRLNAVIEGAPVGDPQQPQTPPGAIMARNNDNHFVHFQIISDYTKTTEYEALDQPTQQSIGQLMTQHLQQVEAQRQQAVQAVERTRGSGKQAEGAAADVGAFGPGKTNATEVAPG